MMKRLLTLCSAIFLIVSLAGESPIPRPAKAATYNPPQPYLVKDIYPSDSGFGNPWNMKQIGGMLIFTPWEFNINHRLWKSDGTEAGTVPLFENINAEDVIEINGALFFTVSHNELWKSDNISESNAVHIRTFYPGTSSPPIIRNLTNFNGTLFFSFENSDGDTELWKSDGTEAGTVWIRDFPDNIGYLTPIDEYLYFLAGDGLHGREPWISDGTAGGTRMLKDIYPGSQNSYPFWFIAYDDKIFFRASDGINGTELWETRGTDVSTQMVEDINPGSGNSYPKHLTIFNNLLFFLADDGTHGEELWQSNGTIADTKIVKDIHIGSNSLLEYKDIKDFSILNNNLFFLATDGVTGLEPWKSDGSQAGTNLLKDIGKTSESSICSTYEWESAVVYNRLFFCASDGGNRLWISDGTSEGTKPVISVNPEGPTLVANEGFFQNTPFVEANGLLFFFAYTSATGHELWALPLQDLILTQSVTPQTPVAAGQPVVYTLSFFNNGHIPSTGVTIQDQLPDQLSNVTWTSSGGITVTLASANPHVWQVGDMQPGEGGTITVVGTVRAGLPGGSSFNNTAKIGNSLREVDTANNTSTTSVTLEAETIYNISLPLVVRNWPPTVTIEDAPNLCKDAYPITNLSLSYLDNFEAELDPDWYRFEAVNGSSYVLEASKLGPDVNPVVMLYDNDCQYLGKQSSSLANGARLQWTHTWPTGWYRLLVYDAYGKFGAETGYQLTIQETP